MCRKKIWILLENMSKSFLTVISSPPNSLSFLNEKKNSSQAQKWCIPAEHKPVFLPEAPDSGLRSLMKRLQDTFHSAARAEWKILSPNQQRIGANANDARTRNSFKGASQPPWREISFEKKLPRENFSQRPHQTIHSVMGFSASSGALPERRTKSGTRKVRFGFRLKNWENERDKKSLE